jgi:predicted metalloprotease
MRWNPVGRGDLEDRRGSSGGGFGGGGMRMGLGGTVVLLVLSLVFGRDFLSMADGGGQTSTGAPIDEAPAGPVASTPEEEKLVDFVNFVVSDAQDAWTEIFRQNGAQYQRAKLVLFRDAIESACGFAQAASGPFYCPGDEKVYIDLGFYEELRSRFGAPGDFAQAYVLAHEVGHHVQHLLGTEEQVRRAQGGRPDQANQLSVRLELQADCYAGIWANSTRQRDILERGDIEEGLSAAAAVGDDRIQRMSGQRVNPDGFTHGTSAQREQSFRDGFQSGSPESCNTFGQ